MYLILLQLIVAAIVCYLGLQLQHEWKYKYLRKIFPCCAKLVFSRLNELRNPDNALKICLDVSKKFKCNAIFMPYPHFKLMVNDPQLIELVWSTSMNKTIEYSFIRPWLFEGILTAKYDKWKPHKKLVAPAFSMENLQHHIHAFNEQSLVLCDKLRPNVNQPSFNIQEYITLCTLDIILNTALGADIKIQDNPSSEYKTSTDTICDVFFQRSFSYYRFMPIYYFSHLHQRVRGAAKFLNDFSMKFITERRSAKSASGIRTILDMLLECEGLTDEEIRAEINTFIFAGHETTGSTLGFTLYELSRNPEVQSKVYNEIVEVVGDDNTPTYKDLESLSYTSMVLKEISRLYPGVPTISRRLTKEIIYKDTVLPKELECYISLFAYHRIEEHFPDAEKFDPERFNDENVKKIPHLAYLPFSIAPRGCIGQKFAQLELKTILVNLLREYEILPDPEFQVHLIAKVSLQSKNGVRVNLKKRQKMSQL